MPGLGVQDPSFPSLYRKPATDMVRCLCQHRWRWRYYRLINEQTLVSVRLKTENASTRCVVVRRRRLSTSNLAILVRVMCSVSNKCQPGIKASRGHKKGGARTIQTTQRNTNRRRNCVTLARETSHK
ncbi:unnamed protein product [Ectocarpus sp. 12 AP-2014]